MKNLLIKTECSRLTKYIQSPRTVGTLVIVVTTILQRYVQDSNQEVIQLKLYSCCFVINGQNEMN